MLVTNSDDDDPLKLTSVILAIVTVRNFDNLLFVINFNLRKG